jgi:endoglucanase
MKKLGGSHLVRRFALAVLGISAMAGCDAGETAASAGAGGATGNAAASSGASSSSSSGSTPPTCAGSTGVSAPNGYHVVGNLICDSSNEPHLFHGVARPSLEWSDTGENISQSDFQLMHSAWNANVVRISTNENFWLMNASGYQGTIANVVQWAEQAGMDVILDLHWSGTPYPGAQQEMADESSITFWTQVATQFKGDGHVLFELYNEPNTVEWGVWQNGGGGYVGMQQLYNAVRGTGANNLVIVGGLDWAYDLSGILEGHAITGVNIAYATHPYSKPSSPEKVPADWGEYWGNVSAQYPVIATEFGTLDCSSSYDTDLMTYADQHNVGWIAWAWYVSGCAFPSIIGDWSGTPLSPSGTAIQAKLLAY